MKAASEKHSRWLKTAAASQQHRCRRHSVSWETRRHCGFAHFRKESDILVAMTYSQKLHFQVQLFLANCGNLAENFKFFTFIFFWNVTNQLRKNNNKKKTRKLLKCAGGTTAGHLEAVRTTWSCQQSKLLSWQWTGGQVEPPPPHLPNTHHNTHHGGASAVEVFWFLGPIISQVCVKSLQLWILSNCWASDVS